MKSNKGVTIIEGVIASALLLLALGGILSLFIQNIKAGKIVDYVYVATNLAKNEIERIREIRREQGLDVLSSSSEEDIPINRNGVHDTNGDFKRTIIVNTNYGTNLVKVTVKVNYRIMGVWSPMPVEIVTVVSPYL